MAGNESPIMQQYFGLKRQHPDFLLFFRVGDFYELYDDDAVTGAEALQITLTRRRTAKEGDEGIPMAGVPYHAVEGYIAKLLEAGFKVALGEQVETAEEAKKARGSSALVKREVVRLYTPGTLTEDELLTANRPNYLAAVAGNPGKDGLWRGGLAWLDLSTGEVGVRGVTVASLGAAVAALAPGEVVVPPALEENLLSLLPRRQVSVQESLFGDSRTRDAVGRAYGVAEVGGFGIPEGAMVQALGALLGYAELTQIGKLPPLKQPQVQSERSVLAMDASTRRNLEVTESLQGNRKDCLLGEIDKTVTAAGGRLLGRWLAEPSAVVGVIQARQEAVQALLDRAEIRANVRAALKRTGDIARCVSRLLLGRGGPRDLAVLKATGTALPELGNLLGNLVGNGGGNSLLETQMKGLGGLENLTATLMAALGDDPLPALIREGNFIRTGYDQALDEARRLLTDGNGLLAELEASEAAASGIPLKLRYNKVWGYYFELNKSQAEKVPGHFIHRQTTTGTHRYTTEKLMEFERAVGSASATAQRREEELFAGLCDAVRKASYPLLAASEALAITDVLASLAEMAGRDGWVRPLVDESRAFSIVAGKHPVVASRVGTFVPNDSEMSDGKLWLITGPNMAGKSTYLRQNALLCILAQVGSFVPAKSAHIGIADAVYSRIGAADNLAAGQSTFMVEMVETAQILNRSTDKSLVILDELGRGTATYDGLAIAWACVEHIAQQLKCRTLFATHYHELTSLCETLPGVEAHHVAVKEWKGEIVFLHEVKPGAAGGSYGVHVAKLAGVPKPVVNRAEELLNGFMKAAGSDKKGGRGVLRVDEMSLFAAPTQTVYGTVKESAVEARLKEMDVDSLSPREALDAIYLLKGQLQT